LGGGKTWKKKDGKGVNFRKRAQEGKWGKKKRGWLTVAVCKGKGKTKKHRDRLKRARLDGGGGGAWSAFRDTNNSGY